MIACRALVNALQLLDADATGNHGSFRNYIVEALHMRWSHMDVGWARVDAGYGIARDLAGFSRADAESIIAETDDIRKEWQIAAQPGAWTYTACLRILIRTFSGLVPLRIDNQSDLLALVALIDILPSYGERAVLWADLAMRAFLAGRSELATRITNSYLCPSLSNISKEDWSYRSSVIIRVAPALYKAQPPSCLEQIEKLPWDDRDAALLKVVRFLLWNKIPSDPAESGSKNVSETSHELFVIIALCLPKSMDAESSRLLTCCDNDIPLIPWDLDQVDRLLGLAEDLQGKNTPRCRGLINRAAETISKSKDDLCDQRRHLVDIAYRVDDDFAKQLIETFDDDEAKRRAQGQVRLRFEEPLLNLKEGQIKRSCSRKFGSEVHKLGMLFLKGLNAGGIQHYHPNEIREYIELAANQPLSRAFPMLNWYVENATSRYARSDQAVTFFRPLFDACVVGTRLAGQISGRSLIHLKALKQHSNELSSAQSLLVTPESREDAMRIINQWYERNLGDEVTIHNPYFGPDDLCWLQQIRTANPKCVITVMTARKHQPSENAGTDLEDIYVEK